MSNEYEEGCSCCVEPKIPAARRCCPALTFKKDELSLSRAFSTEELKTLASHDRITPPLSHVRSHVRSSAWREGVGTFIANTMTEEIHQTGGTVQFWTVNKDPSKRVLVTVDERDAWLASRRWTAKWKGGRVNGIYQSCTTARDGKKLLHRLILCPSWKMQVDHIDMNPANNRRSNLRECSHNENLWNSGARKCSTSGLKGAFYERATNKWRARISANGKRVSLGYFDTPEEAHKAYCLAAKEMHGEFARFSKEAIPTTEERFAKEFCGEFHNERGDECTG